MYHPSACLVCVQVGNYYLYHGGTLNKCPFTPCRNAKLGYKYIGMATKEDACQTVPTYVALIHLELCLCILMFSKDICVYLQVKCNDVIPKGYAYSSPGSCELVQCVAPPRGMYYTESCAMGCGTCNVQNCTNRRNVTTYHAVGFTNVTDQCPLQACGKLPPP